jgi:hypothetical protein
MSRPTCLLDMHQAYGCQILGAYSKGHAHCDSRQSVYCNDAHRGNVALAVPEQEYLALLSSRALVKRSATAHRWEK